MFIFDEYWLLEEYNYCRISGWWEIFVVMYILIYACSKGLNVITVAMMCHLAKQLGGCHWQKLLCIPVDRGSNISVY